MNTQLFYLFYHLAHHSQILDRVIVCIADSLPWVITILIVMYAGIKIEREHRMRYAWALVITGAASWIASAVLKIIFSEPRPFVTLHDVAPLFQESGFAFPSGHATLFMALAVVTCLYHKRIGTWFVVVAVLIGLARIAAGVHYPFDILGGFILGGVIAYLVHTFLNRWLSK